MELDPKKFYRFLGPRGTVLVTTASKDGTIRASPVSFAMPVSIDPPMIAISLSLKTPILESIKETRQFAVNVPTVDIIDRVMACSKGSSEDVNQIRKACLTEMPSLKLMSPLVGECVAWFECLSEFYKEMGDHALVVGSIAYATVKDDIVGKDGNIILEKAKIPLHLGGSKFAIAEKEISVKDESKQAGK